VEWGKSGSDGGTAWGLRKEGKAARVLLGFASRGFCQAPARRKISRPLAAPRKYPLPPAWIHVK
jgi:hypothetical protein